MQVEPADGRMGNAAFVKMRKYYLNMDCGTGRLLSLLRENSAALGIIQRDTPLISTRIRSSEVYILTSIGLKCTIARVRRLLGFKDRFVSLPDRGEVAMFCFPDRVRIFDLNGHQITNLCSSDNRDYRQKLAMLVEHQEALGELGVAPRIYRKENGDNYVEELCQGIPLKKWKWWDRDVFREITRAARVVQASRPAVSRAIKDMVDELNGFIESLENLYPASMKDTVDKLVREIRSVCDDVDPGEDLEGLLSHGDLARRNILVRNDDSLVFIDWQTLDYRTRDYDIYNYHFSIVEDETADRVSEETVFEWLDAALGLQDREAALRALNRFRLEYYITRFKYFLPSRDPDASRVAQVLQQMYDYTICFRRYEEHLQVSRSLS